MISQAALREAKTVSRRVCLFSSFLLLMVSALPAVAASFCDAAAVKNQNAASLLSSVEMSQQASGGQLAGDWYAPEENRWRWMGKAAAVFLAKPRQKPVALRVEFYLSEDHVRAVEAVLLTLELNGKLLDRQKYEAPGSYTYRAVLLPEQVATERICVRLSVNKTFQPAGEKRLLGLVVSSVGLIPNDATEGQ